MPRGIEFLRKFPNLKRLGYKFDPTTRGPDRTAAEFWADHDTAKTPGNANAAGKAQRANPDR